MRQKIVAGNWKMNGSKELTNELLNGLIGKTPDNVIVIVCPPAPYLDQAHQLLQKSNIHLGAQNVHNEESGAFTGEVTAGMLKDVGCEYVIIGHSERRQIFGETSEFIAQKCAFSVESGLKPIVCLGETLEERESGITEDIIAKQLQPIIDLGADVVEKIVIAYEPIWAIGTGKTATPEQAQQVHKFIRNKLRVDLDEKIAENMPLLYGGSVKPDNATTLFGQPDIDGGLIGGASLQAEPFLAICEAANMKE